MVKWESLEISIISKETSYMTKNQFAASPESRLFPCFLQMAQIEFVLMIRN